MAQLPRIFLFCRTAMGRVWRLGGESEKIPQPEAAEKNMT